jgi:hypothetical protein
VFFLSNQSKLWCKERERERVARLGEVEDTENGIDEDEGEDENESCKAESQQERGGAVGANDADGGPNKADEPEETVAPVRGEIPGKRIVLASFSFFIENITGYDRIPPCV